MELDKAVLQKAVTYKTSRSGGKGGQNVNKVSTKVELLFDIQASSLLNEDQKTLLTVKLQSRMNKEGLVQVICEEERSQLMNKERAIDKLIGLLIHSLHQPKVRKPIKVSRHAKAKRLEQKRMLSVKKQLRRGEF